MDTTYNDTSGENMYYNDAYQKIVKIDWSESLEICDCGAKSNYRMGNWGSLVPPS